MNCLQAQSEISRTRDERNPLSSEVSRHVSICDECASFRETTAAFERQYRRQVRSGIERLRRLDPLPARPRTAGRVRVLIPIAAALLLGGWGLLKLKVEAPPALPTPGVQVARAKPVRSLLFDDAGLLGRAGPELSFLEVGEPRLPSRLDQDLQGLGMPDPEISLPRNLKFRN